MPFAISETGADSLDLFTERLLALTTGMSTGVLGAQRGNAIFIAFLLIGLPHLLPNAYAAILNYVGWLLPLSMGLGAQLVFDRRHRTRQAVPMRVPA